ncbi:MAG: hypothetical protein ACI4IV_06100, partial [Acutalibacteraceae bacterium]
VKETQDIETKKEEKKETLITEEMFLQELNKTSFSPEATKFKEYNNMDHSMLTAIEAVNAIMGKSDRRDVWSVNTESEYHESAQ